MPKKQQGDKSGNGTGKKGDKAKVTHNGKQRGVGGQKKTKSGSFVPQMRK